MWDKLKEFLLRKPVLITAAIVAALALAGGVTALVLSETKPAASVPEQEQVAEPESEPEAEPEPEPEKVTAQSLVRKMTDLFSNAETVAGETAYEIVPALEPVAEENEEMPTPTEEATGEGEPEEKAAAYSVKVAYEVSRSGGVVHTAGTMTKDGAGDGIEDYALTGENGMTLLSSRGGHWSIHENAPEGPAVGSIDDILTLLRLPGWELRSEEPDENGVYTMTGEITGSVLYRFRQRSGMEDEFPKELMEGVTRAEATLQIRPDGTPVDLNVNAPAAEGVNGFVWHMTFLAVNDGRSIAVPLEDIRQVVDLEAAKAAEDEKKKKEEKDDPAANANAPAAYHTDVWVDVDLTNQCITLHADGKVVMTSSCVTGNISRGMATPTGTYRVSYKTTNAYLLNDAFVNYWMPFNGGIGFHDASWRYGVFTPDQAYYNGSHGCVNLPYGAAQTLYSYLHAGDVVYVHGWPQNPANMHKHTTGDWTVVKEATCTEEGKKVRKCTSCGEEIEASVIPKTEHTEGEWKIVSEATEEREGQREMRCSVCGTVMKTETIPKLPHEHKASGQWEIVKAPTCTEDGERVQRCVKDKTVVISEVLPATGHQGGWEETPATCTTDGVKTRTCTVCGQTETVTIPATGHVAGNAVTENAVEPTCEEPGSHDSVTYCSFCGIELNRETIVDSALGHSWGEVDADGWRTCTRCGFRELVVIPPEPPEPEDPVDPGDPDDPGDDTGE